MRSIDSCFKIIGLLNINFKSIVDLGLRSLCYGVHSGGFNCGAWQLSMALSLLYPPWLDFSRITMMNTINISYACRLECGI